MFAADTLAYFTGRVAGRHSLAPRLSPKKTWEGLVGGALAGVFVSFIALYDKRDVYLCVWQAIVLGLVVVVAAVLGDLFESALKRDLEVKDTGRLLGGHGGVLDRVDALLFAAPAAYFLVVSYGFRTGAAVADVNGDGRPDLFVAGYTDANAAIPDSVAGFPSNHLGVRDLLFLNEGNGPNGRARFREVGEQWDDEDGIETIFEVPAGGDRARHRAGGPVATAG